MNAQSLTADRGASATHAGDAGLQAYRLLHFAFVVAPIVAGLDKFVGFLTDWSQYLAPFIAEAVGADMFLMIVGVVEIVAGIGVALKPRIFAYVVAAWLGGIIVNLLLVPGFLDIALRDLGLALAALALARLSTVYGK